MSLVRDFSVNHTQKKLFVESSIETHLEQCRASTRCEDC